MGRLRALCRSLGPSAMAVLAGLGLSSLLGSFVTSADTLLGPYIVYALGIPGTHVLLQFASALLPLLVSVFGGAALVGWLAGRRGWAYGLVLALCLVLPEDALVLLSWVRVPIESLAVPEGPMSAWPYAAPSAGLTAGYLLILFTLPSVAHFLLGALGGLCGGWIHGLRRRPLGRKATAVLLAVGLVLLGGITVHVARSWLAPEEVRFRELFGTGLNRGLLLVTDRGRYSPHEEVSYWAENRTGRTISFPDDSLGLHCLAYDGESGDWIELDTGDRWRSDEPVAVESGVIERADSSGLTLEYVAVPADGQIRLVITGHTDAQSPDGGRSYTAYRDIWVSP
jgi:hypothetical protein